MNKSINVDQISRTETVLVTRNYSGPQLPKGPVYLNRTCESVLEHPAYAAAQLL